jgi:hypothetical protein
MPDSCGRVLRVEAGRQNQAALLLRSQRRRVVRVRWTMGALEGPQWQLGQNVLDSNHDSKRRDLSRP